MRWTAFTLAIAGVLGCGGGEGSGGTTIGPTGGNVSGPEGAGVTLPQGAVESDTSLAVDTVSSGYPSMPSDMLAEGSIFAFTPHGQTFATPVNITVPFTGAATEGLRLVTASPGGLWTSVDGAAVSGNAMTAHVSHFSFFAVVGTGTAGDGGTTDSLDGEWTWASATCNGTALDFGSAVINLAIAGGTGVLASHPDPTCTQTINFTVTYPSTDSFEWTMASAPTCSPANCIDAAGACDGTVVNQVFTGTYTIEGNTAVVTIPNTPATNFGCASSLEVVTLQR